jgi:hypothetical protein
MSTMSSDEAYAAVIRQATHDAVRAQLAAPPYSVTGSSALRAVTDRLAAAHGAAAVRDLAEELAVDLAEAFARGRRRRGALRPGRPRRLVPRHARTLLAGTAARGPPRSPARSTLVTDEGTSSLAPTPEVIARRLRDLRQTAGQHEAQLGRHGEQLASIGEQLRELARLQQLASTRHADLAAAWRRTWQSRWTRCSGSPKTTSASCAPTSTCY